MNSGRSANIFPISLKVIGSTSPDPLSTEPRNIANLNSFSTCEYDKLENDVMLSLRIAPCMALKAVLVGRITKIY